MEYLFLFVLGLVWLFFAMIHDFKTKEVPNWLNFSLIAIALAYRAFYSVFLNDWMFFVYGLIGLGIFVVLAFIFYYGRAFAGGDAKLLMGVGAVLPLQGLNSYIWAGVFLFLLFGLGTIYSLIYTLFLVFRKKGFVEEFKNFVDGKKVLVFCIFLVGLLAGVFFINSGEIYLSVSFFILGLMPLFYIYAKVIDNIYMIKLISPDKLTEGDWIVKDIKTGTKVIKKSVNGLSKNEILILKKSGKKVLIRDGIPFSISFFLAFMVFVVLFYLFPEFFLF